MKNFVLLSIIVPVYNSEKTLRKCVENLLEQSIAQNIEILLINDGSTDNSLELCRDFALTDSRVKVFNRVNSGLSSACNFGIEKICGEYLAFASPDGFADMDYYENLVDTCFRRDSDVCCASIVQERVCTKKYLIHYSEDKVFKLPQDKIDAAKLPDKCTIWNMVFRTAFIKKFGLRFIEDMYFGDLDFASRAVFYSNKLAISAGSFYHLKQKRAKNLRKSDNRRFDDILSKKYVLEFFRKHNLTSCSKNLIRKKKCVKCLGLTLIKSYEWETKKVYYLFGAIPVLEKVSYA